MIPIFTAWKSAATIWKVVSIVAPILILGVGYLACERHKQEVLQDQLRRQQEAVGHFIVREKLKLLTVERTASQKDKVNAALRKSYQEVMELAAVQESQPTNEAQHETSNSEPVPATDCPLDPTLVRAVNGLARVLDDAAGHGAPASGGAAGQPAL